MPGPSLLPIIAAQGASGLKDLYNTYQTDKQNRRSEDFSREMYQRQYDDTKTFWNEQNMYNSPKAQMERFKEAGLNPFLIYGQGNPGNASSRTAPSAQQPKFVAPQIETDGIQTLLAFADIQVKNAQADNLLTQNTVLQEEQALKRAQTAATMTDRERKVFDLELEKDLRGTSLEYRKGQLRQLTSGTSVMLQRNEREAVMQAQNIKESVERVNKMRIDSKYTQLSASKIPHERAKLEQELKNLKAQKAYTESSTAIAKLEKQLNEMGIQKGDNILFRILGQYLSGNPSLLDKASQWKR